MAGLHGRLPLGQRAPRGDDGDPGPSAGGTRTVFLSTDRELTVFVRSEPAHRAAGTAGFAVCSRGWASRTSSFSGGLSPWLGDGRLLAVSPRGGAGLSWCLLLFRRAPGLLSQAPQELMVCLPSHISEAPFPVTLGGRCLPADAGGAIQPKAMTSPQGRPGGREGGMLEEKGVAIQISSLGTRQGEKETAPSPSPGSALQDPLC